MKVNGGRLGFQSSLILPLLTALCASAAVGHFNPAKVTLEEKIGLMIIGKVSVETKTSVKPSLS